MWDIPRMLSKRMPASMGLGEQIGQKEKQSVLRYASCD